LSDHFRICSIRQNQDYSLRHEILPLRNPPDASQTRRAANSLYGNAHRDLASQ
jgi:hypothetical protein